jgi:hypothetical protein
MLKGLESVSTYFILTEFDVGLVCSVWHQPSENVSDYRWHSSSLSCLKRRVDPGTPKLKQAIIAA